MDKNLEEKIKFVASVIDDCRCGNVCTSKRCTYAEQWFNEIAKLALHGQAVIDVVKANRESYGGDLADLGSKDGWEMYADIDGMVE